jgi:hypothetical protein
MRFAYADPPYPGKAKRCYGGESNYAGEVDHAELVAELAAGYPDGWALSTGAYALREVLSLCPEGARVCPWVKPNGVSRQTRGLHNAWEALIVVGGRQRPPGVRDWLRAKPAIRGGTLVGRKPLAFCAWLFDCLGMQPGDQLADLYPGTGIVGRAWALLCAEASPAADRHASLVAGADASATTSGDASARTSGDASPGAARHASPTPAADGSQASPLEHADACAVLPPPAAERGITLAIAPPQPSRLQRGDAYRQRGGSSG